MLGFKPTTPSEHESPPITTRPEVSRPPTALFSLIKGQTLFKARLIAVKTIELRRRRCRQWN